MIVPVFHALVSDDFAVCIISLSPGKERSALTRREALKLELIDLISSQLLSVVYKMSEVMFSNDQLSNVEQFNTGQDKREELKHVISGNKHHV